MQYELKSAKTTGAVKSNNDGTMTQFINVAIGVKTCPYEDIKTERTVEYVFSENLTAKQAEEGITTFATQWVADNYPTT
jgi:hypothetical protein